MKVRKMLNNQPFALYLDRLPMHRSNWLRDELQKLNVTRILAVPASPQFNPIEGCFSIVKNAYKRAKLHHFVNKLPFEVMKQINVAFNRLRVATVNAQIDKSMRILLYPEESRQLREQKWRLRKKRALVS